MTTELENDQLPKYTWWALGLTAVLLLILTVTAIGFISAGTFDPQPVGQLTAEQALKPQYLPGQSEHIQWLNEPPPTTDFSLRLTAAYQSGDLDAGYGLALTDGDSVWLVALSPLGYVTIRALGPSPLTSGDSDDLDNMIANGPASENSLPDTVTLEWQTWPHVNQDKETNEIWLDNQDGILTIHINREYLWSGPLPFTPTQIGLYTTTFNTATTINFQTLQTYAEQ